MNGLRKDLHDKTYQPQPVRRKTIPKPGGGERALGIPTIRDRVAQTAAKLIVRRMRFGRWMNCCMRDIRMSWTRICRNTLTPFRYSELMQCVARRIVDRQMLSVTDG